MTPTTRPQAGRTASAIRVATWAGVAGPIVFTIAWLVTGARTPGYSHVRQPISQLAALGSPYPAIQQAGFFALTAAVVGLAWGLPRVTGRSRILTSLLAAAAVAVALTSVFRDDLTGTEVQSNSGAVHRATGGLFFMLMIVVAFVVASRVGSGLSRRGVARFSWASGTLSLVLFVVYGVAISSRHPLAGLSQRLLAFSLMTWLVVMSLWVRREALNDNVPKSWMDSARLRLLDFLSRKVTNPRMHTAVYRISSGRLGSRLPMVGPGVLLLTTTGRRSGDPHTNPLVFFRDGDNLVVAATNHGTGRVPAWLLNLRDHPEVKIQVGSQETKASAEETKGPERDRLWNQMVDQHPLFSVYEQRAPTLIPVVSLAPHGGPTSELDAEEGR